MTENKSDRIFTQLFNLGFDRSVKQAFGFYFAYLFIGIAVIFAAVTIFGPSTLSGDEIESLLRQAEATGEFPPSLVSYQAEVMFFSKVISLTFTAVLAILVAYKKKILEQISVLFIISGAAVTGYFLGLIISLGFVAWLSTKPANITSSSDYGDASDGA